MKTKTFTYTTARLVDAVTLELFQIAKVTELCAFAAESRRVLEEIDRVANLLPEVDTALSTHIESRSEWSCHDNNLALVLKEVTHRIESVKCRLEGISPP